MYKDKGGDIWQSEEEYKKYLENMNTLKVANKKYRLKLSK